MSHDARLEDLVIPSGQSASNAIINPVGIQNIIELVIYGAATFTGTTITVQVSPVQNPSAGDWYNFQFTPGTDVVIAAGKAVRVACRCIKAIRLLSNGAEAADRVCPIVVQQDT
jgi:hypothetical protein